MYYPYIKQAPYNIQLGRVATKGLGAGSDPSKGKYDNLSLPLSLSIQPNPISNRSFYLYLQAAKPLENQRMKYWK